MSERIKILLDRYFYGNKAAMGRSLSVSGQAIADLIEGKKGGPSFPVLQKMLTIHSEVRAEWLVLGEEPMLKTKVELGPDKTPVAYSANQEKLDEQATVALNDEQLSQIFQAVYRAFAGSEEIRELAISARAKAQAEANMKTNIYRIGAPDPTRPYNGLLTERLDISEEEARALIQNGEIQARHIGSEKHRRITNYRISEDAVLGYLEGLSVEQFRAKMEKLLR